MVLVGGFNFSSRCFPFLNFGRSFKKIQLGTVVFNNYDEEDDNSVANFDGEAFNDTDFENWGVFMAILSLAVMASRIKAKPKIKRMIEDMQRPCGSIGNHGSIEITRVDREMRRVPMRIAI